MSTEPAAFLGQIQFDFDQALNDAVHLLGAPLSPIESLVDRVIDSSIELANRFLEGPNIEALGALREQAPRIPAIDLPTPFGKVRTGAVGLPELGAIKLDPRKREAFKSTIAIDVSGLIGIIPVLGDLAADVLEDTYGAKLRDLLSTEEMNLYTEFDKTGPSSVALARTFVTLGTR